MLAGTRRSRDELLRAMPPDYVRLTLEQAAINATVGRPYRALLPDADHGEGTSSRFQESETPRDPDAMISKLPSVDEVHGVVAGGTAGRFSVANPGWL